MTPSDAPASISPADEPPTAPSSDAIVHADLPCRDCGYNLRTLAHDHGCPECGLSVAWSVYGYQLKHARLSWLRRLRRGCDLLIVHFIFQTIAFLAYIGSVLPPFDNVVTARWVLVSLSAFAIAVICGIAGAWMLTMEEHPNRRRGRRRRYRRIVRILLPIVGLACGAFVFGALERAYSPSIRLIPLSHRELLLIMPTAIIPTVMLLVLHLDELAGRSTNPIVGSTFVGLFQSLGLTVTSLLILVLCDYLRIDWAMSLFLLLFIGLLCVHLLCCVAVCVELQSELQNAIAFGTTRPS